MGRWRRDAYKRTGIDPNVVMSMPKISPFIARIPGGWEFVLDCLRASSDATARQFLKYYDDPTLPLYVRAHLPVEAFCLLASITPEALMNTIIVQAQVHGIQMARLVAAVHFPKVIQTSVDEAAKPEGIADRELQMKHAGFLPMPKGSQVSVNVNASANAQSATLAPSPEDSIRRLQDQFSEGRRTLHAAENASAAMLPEMIDAEVVPPMPARELDAMAPVRREAEE